MTLKQKLYTVWAFFQVNLKRLFRDRLALFFTFLFPLIFLFVFGGLNSHNNDVSFSVGIINRSQAPFAKQLVQQISKSKVFDVDKDVTSFTIANQKMSRGELDATLELPKNFGTVQQGSTYPSGQVIVHYTQNNQSAATTLTSVLQGELQKISSTQQAQYLTSRGESIPSSDAFTAVSKQNNEHSLSSFDYTVTGLLGFSILGAGIFGPINVFPELKKMGILRRLHTTPLRVWQYFLSVMLGNAVSGLMSLAVMLIVAVAVFHLKLAGNYFELGIFLAFSIIMILGIGLAVGGWAKNERQAAPLANIIVFPMMFLSGTFFPRFLMPQWLQHITNFLPLTPVIDGARLIATEGDHLTQLGPQLAMMGGWLVVVYFIAFRVFRWE
jgi:ABC-2 type transport system permease protein